MNTSQTEAAAGSSGRRRFLQKCTLLAGAVTALLAGRWRHPASLAAAASPPSQPLPETEGNHLLRMQSDLDRALAKPLWARNWVMVVDTRKCVGCNACTVACRAENLTGPAGSYRRVRRTLNGRGVYVSTVFKPSNCMQCDNPLCAKAVPDGLIRKRPDGIVEFDYARLKGSFAQAAARACPYGAVHIDDGKRFTDGTPAVQAYETRSFKEYDRVWHRGQGTPLAGVARKCHFCPHLLEAGILPACVTTCVGGAMFFGDRNDASSLASQLLRQLRTLRYLEDRGAQPRVFYVDERLSQVPVTDCAVCHY